MRTRSSTSTSPLRELVDIPRRRNRRRAARIVEPEIRVVPIDNMADDRTMAEML